MFYGLIDCFIVIYLAMPDPFAVVTVDGEQTHTTLSDKGTLNPFWNNMCRFVVFQRSVLSIQIFDQKKFKKDGQGFLGVATFIVSSAIDLRIPTSSKNEEDKLKFLILLFLCCYEKKL